METKITSLTPLTGARIGLRPWNRRRDRQQIDRWPPHIPALPAHWLAAPDPLPAYTNRVSYAVDLLTLSPADRMVGRISLRTDDVAGFPASIGYVGIALHPGHLGKGIGTEALTRFAEMCRIFGLADTLWLDVAAENIRAIRCYDQSGFVYVDSEWRGEYRYHIMMQSL